VDDKSTPFLLLCEPHGWQGFCSFVVVSFPTPSRRSLCLRLAVSRVSAGLSSLPLAADFAVAFVDIADLSGEERFKVDFLELRNSELQVVAVAKLHSAAQRRWTPEPVPPPSQAKFLDYTVDAQASRLYEHIAAAAGIAVQSPQRPGLASAAKARDPELGEFGRRAGTDSLPEEGAPHPPSSARVPSSPMSPPKGGASEDERLLWSLLGAFGCAPETRCSCRWPEDDAEAARRHKEALFPRPRGACSEETIDLRSDPPASGAAKTSNPGLARARPVTDVRW